MLTPRSSYGSTTLFNLVKEWPTMKWSSGTMMEFQKTGHCQGGGSPHDLTDASWFNSISGLFFT